MTYAEFCELRQKLAQVEQEYLNAWNASKDYRKRGKQLSKLAIEMSELQDKIYRSPFWR